MPIGTPKISIKIFQEERTINIQSDLGDENSEIKAVTTSKDIATPTGTFSITFVPKQKWFTNIHVFDFVEIQMAGAGEKLKIVMRGLVDSVNKTESWEGEPQRQITVSGRDLGCLLTDFKVFYIPALAPIEALKMKIMPWSESSQKTGDVGMIFDYIWEKLGKYIDLKYGANKKWTQLLDHGASSMFPQDDDTGIFYLLGYEGDFWGAFCKFLDKPFHELFIYDAPDKSYLIMRPSRLKDAQGNLSKSVTDVMKKGAIYTTYKNYERTYKDPKNAEGERYAIEKQKVDGSIMYPNDFYVPKENKISISVAKNMSEVYTSYFTRPLSEAVMKMGFIAQCINPWVDQPENCENPFFQLDPNYPACIDKYGYRPLEAGTVFVDLGLGKLDASLQNMTQEEIVEKGLIGKTIRKNRHMVAWFMHNEFLLSGNMEIRGTNKAIIGTYVTDDEAEYYVEGVTHNFVLFQGFTTSLRITRGMYLTPEEAGTESRDKWNKFFFATNVYSKIPIRVKDESYWRMKVR